MGLPRTVNKLSAVIMILSLVILLYLGAALTITTDAGFYLSEFEKLEVYGNFENDAEPIRLAYEVTNYFMDGSASPPEIEGFNQQETSHLKDVKLVVFGLKRFFYLSVFLFIASLVLAVFLSRGHFSRNRHNLLKAAGMAILGIGLLLVLLALFFSTTFTLFHQLFFPQGNWQFPADSTLIRLFPEQFFLDAFLRIILRVCFFGLLLLSLGLILKRYQNKQKEL